MKTCTQTAALQQHFGVEGAIRQIAASGFDHYDVTMTFLKDDDNVFNSPEWRTETEKLRRVAEECGITCHQAHAPFPSSKAETEENRHYNEVIFDRIVRSMEIAALLGARQIVIHPKHHVNYYANREALTELNLAFYRDLLPYAKRFGIRVAVENMFQRDMVRGNVIVESTCADPREFCAYLDALDPEWFVGCLDIGHVGLVSRSAPDVIRALGHDRIHALHVHDNDFVNDLHTLPFTRNCRGKRSSAPSRRSGMTA